MPAMLLTAQEAAAAAHLAREHNDSVRVSWQPGDEGIVCEIAGRRWAVTLEGGLRELGGDDG